MSKQPAIQFYIGDWLKDPELSMCSPATRGIWMDLLCAMHELNRSGQITGTVTQLSRLCRCTAVEMSEAIGELKSTKTASVTERNGNVTVVNRRMQREAKERESANNRQLRYRERKRSSTGYAPVTEMKRESNTASSSSSSISSSKSSSSNARAPAAAAGFFGIDKSKFSREQCLEYVNFLVKSGRRDIHNPTGLAFSMAQTGDADAEIQAWLDNDKKFPNEKRGFVSCG